MMKYTYVLCVVLIAFTGCKKSDPEPAAADVPLTYMVFSNKENAYATISTYDVASANFGPETYRSNSASGNSQHPVAGIADIASSSGKIYVAGRYTRTLDVIDAKTYKAEKSITFGKGGAGFPKYMTTSSGKAFISDGELSGPVYIKVVNLSSSKVDSIAVASLGIVYSIVSINNKVFFSWFGNGVPYISVIADNDYKKLTTLTLQAPVLQLIAGKDNVFGTRGGGLIQMNASSLAMTETAFSGMQPSGMSNRTIVVDATDKTIYYLRADTGGRVLCAYDVASKTESVLKTEFIPGSTIALDSKSNVIVVAGVPIPYVPTGPLGTMTLYDLTGKEMNKFTWPDVPEKIVVMP